MAHVPAWKRLGLKLKNVSNDNGASAEELPSRPAAGLNGMGGAEKRKPDSGPTEDNRPGKKPKSGRSALRDGQNGNIAHTTNANGTSTSDNFPNGKQSTIARRKSVTFSEDTKQGQGTDVQRLSPSGNLPGSDDVSADASNGNAEERSSDLANSRKQKVRLPTAERAKNQQLPPSYVQALHTFHNNRGQWKFNKNHQTTTVKNVFKFSDITTKDEPALISYISGIQSLVQLRILQTAAQEALEETKDLAGQEDQIDDDSTMNDEDLRKRFGEDALKARLKQDRKRKRKGEEAASGQSDEFQHLLRKRRRAAAILAALPPIPEPSSSKSDEQASTDDASNNNFVQQPTSIPVNHASNDDIPNSRPLQQETSYQPRPRPPAGQSDRPDPSIPFSNERLKAPNKAATRIMFDDEAPAAPAASEAPPSNLRAKNREPTGLPDDDNTSSDDDDSSVPSSKRSSASSADSDSDSDESDDSDDSESSEESSSESESESDDAGNDRK